MLLWLRLPFYDFCCFPSVSINSVYKLHFKNIYLPIVQLMPLPPHHFLAHYNPESLIHLSVSTYPGCPEKEAIKWVAVLCCCYTVCCVYVGFLQALLAV